MWPEWQEDLKATLETPEENYAPEPLEIKNNVIPVIWRQEPLTHMNIPEEFPEVEAWAVPIHKVSNLKGEFRTDDLKDFLNLPKDRKLILSTYAYDNYQEMLWKKRYELNQEKYRKLGIDYWFPGHFSIYMDDNKLYQFLSAKRQQIHARLTKSQFVWFGLGENIPVEFLNPIRDAASVLISTSRMHSKRSLDILEKEVRTADEWFPKETSFFVVGGTYHFPSISEDRACYEFNSRWLMSALKGKSLSKRKHKVSKDKLLIENLKEVLK